MNENTEKMTTSENVAVCSDSYVAELLDYLLISWEKSQ